VRIGPAEGKMIQIIGDKTYQRWEKTGNCNLLIDNV